MKVIVCSDNFFFAKGITALLNEAGHDTWDFFYQPERKVSEKEDEEFVIIIDTNERKPLRHLFASLGKKPLKVFFITDDLLEPQEIRRPFQGVIPRKITAAELLSNLAKSAAGVRPLEFLLTVQQRKVLQYLIRGVTPGVIARVMNISVKTVSAHKRKVMMNFGLKKMNARSLNCMADFIYKSLLVSEHINRQKHPHYLNRPVY
ncbi:hypothetical protein COO59_09750 [Mixta theicola]|uniref:HTH luxR-type domain-containing protein n=1 Tax=Mixta theicola TaxID=1458355 RepID=A0A2K1Q9R9_9GAMM|nr:helix-turn-helix transcriptional regulator [Mixta theicola]PNS11774.1 hypothetical protein COO59_09750 [Mixta theicola]GLR07691.1 hypothetical protein GCM10007905_04100 [Mixta theicola]